MPLSPEQQRSVEIVRRRLGDAEADKLAQQLATETPPPPSAPPLPPRTEPVPALTSPHAKTLNPAAPIHWKPYVSPAQAARAKDAAFTERVKYYVDLQGRTKEDAEKAAAADLERYVEPRDAEGRRVPFRTSVPAEQLDGFDAVKEALKPRTFKTPVQAQREADVRRVRRGMREQLMWFAADHVAEVEKTTGPMKPETREKARQATFKARVEEIVRDMPEAERRAWLEDVAPELLKEPSLLEKGKEAGGKALEWALTSKDEETGAVTESLLATGLRDIGALWRPVFEPVLQATTYEVDEKGRVLDPDDFAYQFEQFLPEYVTAHPTGFGMWGVPRPFQARTVTPETASTGSYWKDVGRSIQRGRSLGDDYMAMPAFAGLYKDLGIEDAPFWFGLGTEIALPISPLSYANLPGKAADAAAELAAKRAARAAGVPAAALAKAADDSSVLEVASRHIAEDAAAVALAKDAMHGRTTPLVDVAQELGDLAERSPTLRRAVAAATDSSGKVHRPLLEEALAQTGRAEARRVASEMAEEMAARFAPMEGGRAHSLSGRKLNVRGKDWGRIASDPINAAFFRAWVDELRDAGHLADVDLKLTPEAFVREYGPILDDPAFLRRVTSRAVAGSVKETLRHRVPSDLVMITPTVLADRKAWDGIAERVVNGVHDASTGKLVEEGVVQLMAGEHLAGGLWRASSAEKTVQALREALGPVRLRAPYWQRVAEDLSSGRELSAADYTRVYNEVLGHRALRLGVGERPFFRGKATREALVPTERRSELARAVSGWTGLASSTARSTLRSLAEGLTTARSGWVADKAKAWAERLTPIASGRRTPAAVANFLDETRAELGDLADTWLARLKAAQKEHGVAEGYQSMVDEALAKGRLSTEEAWQGLLDYYWIEDVAVKPDLVAMATKVGDEVLPLTPANFAAVVDRMMELDGTLAGRGLRTPVRNEPHLFAAMTGWMLDLEAQALVRTSFKDMLASNPELVLRLDPSAMADRAGHMLQQGWLREMGVADEAAEQLARIVGKVGPDDLREAISDLLARKVTTGNAYAPAALPARLEQEARAILSRSGVDAESVETILGELAWRRLGDLDAGVTSFLRAWGMLRGGDIDDLLLHLRPEIFDVQGETVASLFGRDAARTVEGLKEAIADGRLQESLKELAKKDQGLAARVGQLLGWVGLAGSRSARTGLLAGFPLPNLRYHGVNFATAPAIIATTLGVPTMLRSLGQGAFLRGIVESTSELAGRAPNLDRVLFTAADGREWTARMVDDAVGRNGIQFSREAFELGDTLIQSLMREAKMTPALERAGMGTWLARQLDPTGMNVWSQLANWTDNMWRRNVFVAALKEGKTEAEAASMARDSVLDYAKVPSWLRGPLSRYVLFLSFQTMMAWEVLGSLVRDPNTLRRTALLWDAGNREIDERLYQDDAVLARLFATRGKTYDGVDTALMGPPLPNLQSLALLLHLAAIPAQPDVAGVVGEGAEDAVTIPILALVMDFIRTSRKAEDKSMGSVPAQQVALLQELGLWSWFVSSFDVEPIPMEPRDQRRPGEPTFNGMQFRFADKDAYSRYLTAMTGLVYLGVRRNLDDYGKELVRAGMAPEGAEMKRLQDGTFVLAAPGFQTSVKLTDPWMAQDRELRRVMAELSSMSRSK